MMGYAHVMASGYQLVAEQRRAMADLVEGLDESQAATPSLCSGWTVHQTAAHLLTFTHLPMWKFGLEMAKAGFDYDTAADRIARRFADECSPAEVARMLRDRAGKENLSSSFPPEMTTSDVVIHRHDIRRPLGLGPDLEASTARTVLDFLTTHKQAKAILPADQLDGLALSCPDVDWSQGSGAQVTGSAEAVIMAIAGRNTYDELEGPGVELLQSR